MRPSCSRPLPGTTRRTPLRCRPPVPDYQERLGQEIKGLKIGVPREFFGEGLDPEVEAAVQAALKTLTGLGADLVEVSLPHTEYAVATYYVLAVAEASSNLARYDGVKYGFRAEGKNLLEMYAQTRAQGFGAEVRRRIMLGTYTLSAGYYDAYYKKASQVRALIRRDFEAAFRQCRVIATPVAPTPAFRLGEKVDDPLTMYLSDIFTISANLGGIPGISVPCGFSARGPAHRPATHGAGVRRGRLAASGVRLRAGDRVSPA